MPSDEHADAHYRMTGHQLGWPVDEDAMAWPVARDDRAEQSIPRKFEPVHLPEGLGGTVSQTHLRHFSNCPRSAYLYAIYKGEARSMEMERGKALHAVIERSVRLMLEMNEATIPPDVVKVIVDEVLADPEFAVPLEEHDYVREMSFRWAREAGIQPDAVVAVESLFVLSIGGYEVRCKIDLAQVLEEGERALVQDAKSSRHAPALEDVSRKRRDGSRAAKDFQLLLYALALAFGVPVRVEECPADCWGRNAKGLPAGENGIFCGECGDTHRLERRAPFPVASRAQRFDLEFIYPGIKTEGVDGEERMLRRSVSLTRVELEEYRASLEATLTRLRHSEETGDWPAVMSDQACGECPAPAECPIPRELRAYRGTINTMEEAVEAAERLAWEKLDRAARQKELRAFAKKFGPIYFGGDMVWDFATSESETLTDREGLWVAVERAARYGEAVDRKAFTRRSTRSEFKARALTSEEMAAREGSSGTQEDGRDERDEDPGERWGDVPY